MTDTKRLNVSDLDFQNIKTNLKTYLNSQEAFQDYNFEGSALGSLVDLLAYVTHYNAINANLGINETFLDTAQSRGAVVGHARQLGYTPQSARAPRATLSISGVASIPNNYQVKTTINGRQYTFRTIQAYTNLTQVDVYEGALKSVEYIYSALSNEKFIIPDADVDTSTLKVTVKAAAGSSDIENYSAVRSILNVTSTSKVYYLNENPDGKFEISFGDGVIGRALEDGNIITATYIVTNKTAANNASLFTVVSGNAVLTTVMNAAGGAEKESLNSIKYAAPLSYTAQNRAVTPDDYKAIIIEAFSNVGYISCWGGEDNNPPDYGKAYICIKPSQGATLSQRERDQIINTIVRPKAIVSVTPVLVDPDYTYISLEVFFKYDSSGTILSSKEISDAVAASINTYNSSDLAKFDTVLRHSKLLRTIDSTDNSILNSTARVYMKKRFVPVINTEQLVQLNFAGPIYESTSDEPIIYKCSSFVYSGQSCYLQDKLNTDGLTRRVQIVKGSGAAQIVVVDNIGSITAEGITLRKFNPDSFTGSYIEVTVIPNSNDIAPKRNGLVEIDTADVSIVAEADTFVNGRSFAGVRYSTTPRHSR